MNKLRKALFAVIMIMGLTLAFLPKETKASAGELCFLICSNSTEVYCWGDYERCCDAEIPGFIRCGGTWYSCWGPINQA